MAVPNLELVARAQKHSGRIAFQDSGETFTYQQLLDDSKRVALALLDGEADLSEQRVAFLIPSGARYASIQWGIWRAGGIAVPLCLTAAEPELEYAIDDSQASIVIVQQDQLKRLEPTCRKLNVRCLSAVSLQVGESSEATHLPCIARDRRAMMLYTSGTTNRPKGVVTTHANIEAQTQTLVDAWEWKQNDCIPLFLPLHHIHGIINVMSCALWVGAKVEPYSRFDLKAVTERVRENAYSVFMAVPTIYVKLIEFLESMDRSHRQPILDGFRQMRLMVSGSAALPASIHEHWSKLTGQELLERYGMTEIGMGLSNKLHGERRPGAVGVPLPGVMLRLKSDSGYIVEEENVPGEIQVRGPAVFQEYWGKPEVTRQSFDEGWFRTGDMAVLEKGYYRIMGRLSVDMIKSGGYKLSALEIESTLLEHPDIAECAVVGVSDGTWGEAVAAAVVVKSGCQLTLDSLRNWCKDRQSTYKIPKHLLVLDSLPRNAMGKVVKPEVAKLFG